MSQTTTTPTSTSTSTPTTTRTVRLAIRATPEQLWTALTDGAVTPAYYVGFQADFGDQGPGTPYRYTAGGGDVISGRIVDVAPGRMLRTTFNGYWAPEVAALPESVVTFSITDPFMPLPGVTFLTCVHEGLADAAVADHLELGWVAILSGLKTLVESGTPMAAPVDGQA